MTMMRRTVLGCFVAALMLVGLDVNVAHAEPRPSYAADCSGFSGVALIDVKGVTTGWELWSEGSRLWGGEYCQIGKTQLIMQSDGNLVVYDEYGQARWASGTNGTREQRGKYAEFQSDGNFVVYGYDFPINPLWASNTCCSGGKSLVVQADGNVVIYDRRGTRDTNQWVALWATNTWH